MRQFYLTFSKVGMGAKQRRAIAEKLTAIPDEKKGIPLATGRYIGEASTTRLDTIFLAMPIS